MSLNGFPRIFQLNRLDKLEQLFLWQPSVFSDQRGRFLLTAGYSRDRITFQVANEIASAEQHRHRYLPTSTGVLVIIGYLLDGQSNWADEKPTYSFQSTISMGVDNPGGREWVHGGIEWWCYKSNECLISDRHPTLARVFNQTGDRHSDPHCLKKFTELNRICHRVLTLSIWQWPSIFVWSTFGGFNFHFRRVVSFYGRLFGNQFEIRAIENWPQRE